MLQALVAFLPVALTFPENPNSIDSPKAWHPLSTGIGKLPPGSLRAWWDASKLNANDIYWGYFSLPDPNFRCWGHVRYQADGLLDHNILTIKNISSQSLSAYHMSLLVPGLLFKMEGGDDTVYKIVSSRDGNSFVVSPHFTANFSNASILFANLTKWPDSSGNREHMGFWSIADTYNPSIYMLDSASGKIFRDGEVYYFGNGPQTLTGLTNSDVLQIRHPLNDGVPRNSIAMSEIIIGQGTLSVEQRADIEGYLAWKWQTQLQLPLHHVYATSAPQSPWNPSQLGNHLMLWLDANRDDSVFANSSCSEAAGINKRVACWQDLSNHHRHVYQNANFPIYSTIDQGLKSISISQHSLQNPSSLATSAGATWLNDQNYFVALVAKRSMTPNSFHSAGGPLAIGQSKFIFPFIHSHCMGVEVSGKSAAYTEYTSQRSTLVLQGNVRNQLFYQPYFNSAMKSSLTTRSAPTYLHEQPYLIALVADFSSPPVVLNGRGPVFLGTVIPNGTWEPSVYTNRYLGFGVTHYYAPGKLMFEEGWQTHLYDIDPTMEKTVYLVWRKSGGENPLATVNGKPIPLLARDGPRGYLRVLDNALSMLSMGDWHMGDEHRFSGSIYEAMVLTGPKIKYGHQRLIEGYLAWKWGLQHLLPKSHSYRRVPPAR